MVEDLKTNIKVIMEMAFYLKYLILREISQILIYEFDYYNKKGP